MQPVDIPSGSVALVSLIDTTATIKGIPFQNMIGPPVEGVQVIPTLPVFSFLIENLEGRKVLFDLGLRKDFQNLAVRVADALNNAPYKLHVEKEVHDILLENRVAMEEIEAIIWSHHHWDHIGNPSHFPVSVKLVVGPGFLQEFLPGAPESKDGLIQESDYRGRELIEVNFDKQSQTKIAKLPAHDYFGDGSFFILDGPGHAVGHIMGLVRTSTSPSPFILLGADCAHDIGEIRPSKGLPIPESVDLKQYLRGVRGTTSVCPGHLIEAFQTDRRRAKDESLFQPVKNHNVPESIATIEKIQRLDNDPAIFLVLSHDWALKDVLPEFPQTLNDWQQQGWRDRVRWAFLRHYVPYYRKLDPSLWARQIA